MLSTIATFQKIYPKHVFIQIELPQVTKDSQEIAVNQVDLNQVCINPIKQWISESISLAVKPTFPCYLERGENFEFISKLVNGFVLQVGGSRIVFIPSDAIDIEEFEVPQEWVDLPNWAGNYYVPVRVDLEHHYLHLWGFIAHADLKSRGQLDRIFRNYHIAQNETIANLDLLQDSYEFYAAKNLITAQIPLDQLDRLSSNEAQSLIQQLHQRKARFSPRLDLPFKHWGAILDDSQLLQRYCNRETDLGEWWALTKLAIHDGWESIADFINPPQAVPALHLTKKLPALGIMKGVPLSSSREISAAIAELYQQQTELPIPQEPIGVDELIPLLKSCSIAKIWWKAAEYLWTIQPDHPFLITRIRQLETQFGGKSIDLMISMIPTLDNRTAVLARLYPTNGTHLPPGLQLTIEDDFGTNLLADLQGNPYVATAGTEIKSAYIQLYFADDPGDRFVSCITLDNVKVLKKFQLQQTHP
jgi:Protein of unknown function (DUF1822)